MATDALDADAAKSTAPDSSNFTPKVDATIDANAATTRIKVRYAKVRNKSFARRLIFVEIISPTDCPLWRIDANNAPKSWTPPKKMPPIRIHRVTGSHPNIAAPIGPVIGPAPAIDEK